MKIIDWDKKGNCVRFYLGDCDDYYGDDWNDRPYEHNAGTVYEEFIQKIVDICFPFDWMVMEAADDWRYEGNSPYSKEDFKIRMAPCIIAVPPELQRSFAEGEYSRYVSSDIKCIWKFYLGDNEAVLDERGRDWRRV